MRSSGRHKVLVWHNYSRTGFPHQQPQPSACRVVERLFTSPLAVSPHRGRAAAVTAVATYTSRCTPATTSARVVQRCHGLGASRCCAALAALLALLALGLRAGATSTLHTTNTKPCETASGVNESAQRRASVGSSVTHPTRVVVIHQRPWLFRDVLRAHTGVLPASVASHAFRGTRKALLLW